MRNTKFQRVVSFLLAMMLLLGAGVAFNALEMQDYNLFEALIARFSK